MRFADRFETLDREVWLPAYLPAWSSRAAAAASYEAGPDGLRLSLPPGHPLWCPGLHDDPRLRVSAVQSGNWSGPAGGTRGQQPFRDGLVVREEQPRFEGLLVHHDFVEVECRATIGLGSMFSAWMIGMEDEPGRNGEICIVEVFGDAPRAIGCGIKRIRDPALWQEFSAEPMDLDVAQPHRYAIDWRPDGVDFLVDGAIVRRSHQSPAYPMLLILAVFDFPDSVPADAPVPELVVSSVKT